jgi:hypothetical protein
MRNEKQFKSDLIDSPTSKAAYKDLYFEFKESEQPGIIIIDRSTNKINEAGQQISTAMNLIGQAAERALRIAKKCKRHFTKSIPLV